MPWMKRGRGGGRKGGREGGHTAKICAFSMASANNGVSAIFFISF